MVVKYMHAICYCYIWFASDCVNNNEDVLFLSWLPCSWISLFTLSGWERLFSCWQCFFFHNASSETDMRLREKHNLVFQLQHNYRLDKKVEFNYLLFKLNNRIFSKINVFCSCSHFIWYTVHPSLWIRFRSFYKSIWCDRK